MHVLPRPSLLRPRRTIGLVAALSTIFGAGVVTAIALRPAKPLVIAHSTTTMTVPFALPSVIVLPAPPPAAPPPTPPEAPLPIAPRALVPTVNPACVTFSDDDACAWDTGFPAISADGSTLAIRYVPDDSGRGYPGLSILFIDAKTAKTTKTYLVLSPDEYVESEDATWPKLQTKITKRAAIAQRALDDRQFRSLMPIDITEAGAEPDDEVVASVATDPTLHAESNGDSIRLIDTVAHTVVWQRRFPVEAAYPAAKNPNPDGDGCYPSATSGIGVAWDPQTRLLLTTVGYSSGPCFCADAIAYHTTKI